MSSIDYGSFNLMLPHVSFYFYFWRWDLRIYNLSMHNSLVLFGKYIGISSHLNRSEFLSHFSKSKSSFGSSQSLSNNVPWGKLKTFVFGFWFLASIALIISNYLYLCWVFLMLYFPLFLRSLRICNALSSSVKIYGYFYCISPIQPSRCF